MNSLITKSTLLREIIDMEKSIRDKSDSDHVVEYKFLNLPLTVKSLPLNSENKRIVIGGSGPATSSMKNIL